MNRQDAYRLLHDGALALSQVEANGVRIDVSYFKQKRREVTEGMRELTARLRTDPVYDAWRKRFGGKANLGSREQLAEIFFKVLGYPSRGKTEKGKDSTDRDAFSHIDVPFVHDYFRLAKLHKVRDTYIKGILQEVCDGYLHPTFNLHTVVSVRSSSSNPNFQNIPSRDQEVMQLIRRGFIPREGHRLVEVDFSGIEVRVAYCYHKDPTMRDYLLNPDNDMHRDTASELFSLPVPYLKANKAWAKKTVRDWAKNRFVFPQFYGSVFFQCAPHIWEAVTAKDGKGGYRHRLPDSDLPLVEHLKANGVSNGLGEKFSNWESGRIVTAPGTFMERVRKVEKSFWQDRFPVYTAWKERWVRDYHARGYFDTLTGFRLRGVYERNQVLNYAVQGSAFHCLLWSLIELQKAITKRGHGAKIVGQIHDSIIADVPEGEVQDYLDLITHIIGRKLRKAWDWIIVPMEVECEVCGDSWADKRQWIHNGTEWAQAT